MPPACRRETSARARGAARGGAAAAAADCEGRALLMDDARAPPDLPRRWPLAALGSTSGRARQRGRRATNAPLGASAHVYWRRHLASCAAVLDVLVGERPKSCRGPVARRRRLVRPRPAARLCLGRRRRRRRRRLRAAASPRAARPPSWRLRRASRLARGALDAPASHRQALQLPRGRASHVASSIAPDGRLGMP